MINKDELTKIVAGSCGVSVEISSFFFEVFVNRISNKLKPGDLLHFHNHGFFHKRNCRIQIEKTSDSPTPKSYLIQLVLFSSESKITGDLSDIHFLKIPNLKTLWTDDKEFQKSLNAGDFTPYSDRNQLIKSFATKAEVIISSLRKDYDSDLVEELIIPLTFDLNFLVKRGPKSSLNRGSDIQSKSEQKSTVDEKTDKSKAKFEQIKPKKIKPLPGSKEAEEEGLPWNYGTKFLEKDKTGKTEEVDESTRKAESSGRNVIRNQDRDLRRDQASRLKDFEPVTPHRKVQKDVPQSDEVDTVKFSVSQIKEGKSQKLASENKFTEVKSKTESYGKRSNLGKTKGGRYDKYSSFKQSRERAFTARRNYLPIVAVVSFLIIAIIVVYIYFIKGDAISGNANNIYATVKPPNNVSVIERDYKIAVSYPYPKLDNQIELSGFNREILFAGEFTTEFIEEAKPEIKPEIKQETKTEKIAEIKEESKVEKKPEPPVVEEIKPVKENINRIFLYRGFYVVHVGTYNSETTADREADKYFDLGYNAIIEVVESRSRGREYKLNVGDFTSEEFAKEFQEKYLK